MRTTDRWLADESLERERPEQWLENAMVLCRVWKVDPGEAIRAVDSQWVAQKKFIHGYMGARDGLDNLSGIDLLTTIFKDSPSALFQSILGDTRVRQSVEARKADALPIIADKTDKARRQADRAQAKMSRTWRTLCVLAWTDTIKELLPMPPMCLLSDTAIIEAFAGDEDVVGGEAVRQEVHRLGLHRPTAPRYGVQVRRGRLRFVEQHSGVTKKG